MYAVIKSGGKQYRVTPGDRLKIEKLEAEAGAPVVFNEVLMVSEGSEVKVGKPLIENVEVRGTVECHERGKKIVVFTYKKRKGFHKKKGHRQDYTVVRIGDIVTGSAALAGAGEG